MTKRIPDNKIAPELKIWEIPQSDKRPRCGKCLRRFTKEEYQYHSKDLKMCRFNKVCGTCNSVEREERAKTRLAKLGLY